MATTQTAQTSITIKALGDNRVGGYLIKWGSPDQRDLQGEYFTPQTDLCLSWYPTRPMLYHHGLDRTMAAVKIGEIDVLRPDEIGVWAEAQLDMHNEYIEVVKRLIERGVLGWSSGALPQMVKIERDGRIKRWPVVEGSATPAPAEPRGTWISPLKHVADINAPEIKSLGIPVQALEQIANEQAGMDSDMMGGQSSTLEVEVTEMTLKTTQKQEVPPPEEMPAEQKQGTGEIETAVNITAEMLGVQLTPEELAALAQQVLAALQQRTGMAMVEPPMVRAALRDQRWLQEHLVAPVKAIAAKRTPQVSTGADLRSLIGAGVSGTLGSGGVSQITPHTADGGGGRKNTTVAQRGAVNEKTPLLNFVKAMHPQMGRHPDVQDWVADYYAKSANKAGSGDIGPLGGFLGDVPVREDLVAQLRPQLFLDKVGAQITMVPGRTTVQRPRLAKSPEAIWLAENTAVSESNIKVDMLQANPKPLAALYAMPLELLERMRGEDETTLRNELTRSMRLTIDLAALQGSGTVEGSNTGAQPLGVLNAIPAAQRPNLSASGRAPTPRDMTDIKKVVEARDVELDDSTHWVYHPNVLNYFEDLTDTTGQLLNRSQWTKGYEPVTTTQVPTNLGAGNDLTRIFFGVWRYFEIVMSDDIRIVLLTGDTYTSKLQVGVMAYTYVDFLIHYTEGFEVRNNVKV